MVLLRATVELFYDRGNHYEFLSLVQELAAPGEMRAAQTFDFEFKGVEKAYESYHGINVKLRSEPLSRVSLARSTEIGFTDEVLARFPPRCVRVTDTLYA